MEVVPMEANEAQELQEHAEHAEHAASLRPVAFTMSLLAVLVAVTTVVGHRTHTEAVLNQAKASDTWNEYQAKKNRAYDTALVTDLLNVVTVSDANAAKKIAKGYADHQAKWADDLEKETKVAEGFEEEVKLAEHKADYFDFGEALLEIGLVISSVTLLTRSRIYWYFGIGASIIGVSSVVWGFLMR
jgi:response regulator RpfG family c-di-GMP phosphodiesterase